MTQNDAHTVGYVHTGARDLAYQRNMNLINPTATWRMAGRSSRRAINAATRLYPQFNAITLQDAGAITNYNALVVNYSHRFCRRVFISAAYTWSHSISDAPDANSFEQSALIETPPIARAIGATPWSTGRRRSP